ncbi:MAG: hypothetical protein ACYCUW_06070 [bacterium]
MTDYCTVRGFKSNINISYYCTLNVVEASLSHQGIFGLIGRDILEQCILFYNGRLSAFTLSW